MVGCLAAVGLCVLLALVGAPAGWFGGPPRGAATTRGVASGTEHLRLLVSEAATDPLNSVTSVALRPRDERRLYAFLHNPTPQARRVRVMLWAPGHPDEFVAVAVGGT
jgi:hypothetical protein